MQKRSIGIDLIKTERVEKAAGKQSFYRGAFSDAEISYYIKSGSRWETLAGLYCAKEAVVKAAGNLSGLRRLKEIEICHTEAGKPFVRLSGLAAISLSCAEIEISISHDSGFAIASAEIIWNGEAGKNQNSFRPDAIDFSDNGISKALSELRLDVPRGSNINAGAEIVLPIRKLDSHKGDYGRVRIIAGSREMPGAAVMAAESASAALKSGAGLVTLCVPRSMADVFGGRVKEAMLYLMPDENGRILFLDEALDQIVQNSGSIAIGMGMGGNPVIGKIIEYLAYKFPGTLVIDADALDHVAGNQAAIRSRSGETILTPHEGEFRRLFEAVFGYRVNDPSDWKQKGDETSALAERLGAVVLRKSSVTVISDGRNVFYNTTGTPAMAKGGSGDVLSGMISAVSCRLPALDAALYCCYHFGLAGRRASERLSEESVVASDIILDL